MKFYFSTVFLFIILGLSVKAQVNERRIYVLDGTKSMLGFGGAEDVWDNVKTLLVDNIKRLDEKKSEVTLVVFADKIYSRVDGKKNVLKFLETFKPEYITKTNIISGWKEIENLIDPKKFNFVTFLTDGEHNFSSLQKLQAAIKESDSFLGRNNAFACFVRLTPKAIDPLSSATLQSAKNIRFIDGIKFPALIRPTLSKLTVNLREPVSFNQKLFFEKFNDLDFPNDFSLEIGFTDNLDNFKVQNSSISLTKSDGTIPIDLEYSGSISPVASTEIINTKLKLKSFTKDVILITDEVEIEFINKPEKLAQISINPNFGDLNNYPRLLFWSNKTDTVFQTVNVSWSEDAKLSNSSLKLNFKLNGLKDSEYGLVVDGYPQTSKEFEMLSSENAKEIGFYIKEGMESGIKTGLIQISKYDLDRTNIDVPLAFEVKLNNNFHPLKIMLFWIGIIVLLVLLLWFSILRNQIYKKFQKANIQITDPYFRSFKVEGKCKLLFSNKHTKQNFISSVFKGKDLVEVNPIWTSPLILVPGKNKSEIVKILTNREFIIEPFSIYLKRYGEYKIKDKFGNVIKIKIS